MTRDLIRNVLLQAEADYERAHAEWLKDDRQDPGPVCLDFLAEAIAALIEAVEDRYVARG